MPIYLRCISILFVLYIYASVLPVMAEQEPVNGEATGVFSFQDAFSGTGTLRFINTGGEARLVTVCDMSTVDTSAGENCEGVDLKGNFSGGPNGTATFYTTTGAEIKFQLKDGKVFSYSTQGISMEFTVTDPSIFDDTGARDSGARVSDLDGQVEIACPPDLEAWEVMKMGRVIYVDCHIKTGEDSKALISFSDMTTFEMKPESEIIIDTPLEKDSKWTLVAGNIWANVKQMVKDGTMKVHMSQAVAGIKGTRFILTETGKESKIEVMEGSVTFQSKSSGEEVTVSGNQSVKATEKGLFPKTTFNPSHDQTNWQRENNPIVVNSKASSSSSSRMIYLVCAVVLLLILVTSVLFLRKRKQL